MKFRSALAALPLALAAATANAAAQSLDIREWPFGTDANTVGRAKVP